MLMIGVTCVMLFLMKKMPSYGFFLLERKLYILIFLRGTLRIIVIRSKIIIGQFSLIALTLALKLI